MLRPSFEVVNTLANKSFIVRCFDEISFTSPYHFHPEFELTLITKGEGTRYVGNSMAEYREGELVLLGPDLPHCWKSRSFCKDEVNARSIVVQFTYDFFGEHFLSKTELSTIKDLLLRSGAGIQFLHVDDEMRLRMQALANEPDDFKKLILFLELAHALSSHKRYELLDKSYSLAEKSAVDKERITPVLAYIVENYREEIRLDTVAKIANMTPNAFCKYFRKVTHKTFMETVLEFRIAYAIQQLINTNKPILSICYDSGFGDISHFIKIFKSKMLLSPMKYRNKFMAEAGV